MCEFDKTDDPIWATLFLILDPHVVTGLNCVWTCPIQLWNIVLWAWGEGDWWQMQWGQRGKQLHFDLWWWFGMKRIDLHSMEKSCQFWSLAKDVLLGYLTYGNHMYRKVLEQYRYINMVKSKKSGVQKNIYFWFEIMQKLVK